MAYGDLKVRNLIWNTGSGDNTVVLSTLATQSYVTTNFAPKNAPTFTGTINGADLVLSGNLTVNGTQTIINTQTLDVEDKQIEIGKVSSPSDTTANEGGWKLKGASDKTFLWYDSTDAWTSSEHLHLLDNKKLLLGTSSECTFFHDNAGHTYLTTSTGNFHIQCPAGENSIRVIPDGAVQLFFNGVNKFETSNTGVSFGDGWLYANDNAQIRLGNGADLSLYHTTTDSRIINTTGDLKIRSQSLKLETTDGQEYIRCTADQDVKIFHDNVLKLNTHSTGIQIYGDGSDADGAKIILKHLNNNSTDVISSILFSNNVGEAARIQGETTGANNTGVVKVYTDNVGTTGERLSITSTGINVTGAITVNGSALSSAPQITATADGAITAGKTVIVNANGTVKEVGISYTQLGSNVYGEGQTENNVTDDDPLVLYSETSDKFYHIWKNASYVNIKVATLTGSTWAWPGTSQNPHSGGSTEFACGIGQDINKLLIFYQDNGNTRSLARVASPNGNQVSFGTAVEVSPDNISHCMVTYHKDGKFIIAYRDAASPYALQVRIATVSGTSVSLGSEVTIYNGNHLRPYVTEKDSNDKHVIYYGRTDNSTMEGRVLSISGTTPSVGTAIELGDSAVQRDQPSPKTAYDPDNDNYLWVYKESDYKARTLSISGTTLSASTAVQVANHGVAAGFSVAYDTKLKNHVVHAIYNTNTNKYTKVTNSSKTSTPTIGTSYTTSITNVEHLNSVFASGINRFASVGEAVQSSGALKAISVQFSDSATNLTTENYIGVAAGSVSSGASATIDVSGATNASQSSLTPGQKYYVQNNGTLGLTAASPAVFAGTAVAATKIIVNDQAPATAVLWEVLSTHDFGATPASQVIQRGWTNANYQQFKLCWSDVTGGANNVYREFYIEFYISTSDSAQGTLYNADPYYQYFQQKGSYTGTGISGNKNSQRQWRLNNGNGNRWTSGEIIFPATTFNGGGYRPIMAWGRMAFEGGSDFCGCNLAHPMSSNEFLNGVKVYSDGNWTTGRMTWYGLRHS